jgi:hypothetical protein
MSFRENYWDILTEPKAGCWYDGVRALKYV